MKAVIQRVSSGSVTVSNRIIGSIQHGFVVLLGVSVDDTPADADYLAEKISHLRVFEDPAGKMNLSLRDTTGSMLVVSQFTLLADCRKGRRPSFVRAARPEAAKHLFNYFVEQVRRKQIPVATGQFGANMAVALVNDGPVTITIDSTQTGPAGRQRG